MSKLKDLSYFDKDYARRKLTVLVRDIGSYNAGEFWRQMSRIANGGTGRDHAEELEKKVKELEGQLEEAKGFAEWIEILGRTDCEIYKHELKATADSAIERISTALDK